jgi:cell division protein FtsN
MVYTKCFFHFSLIAAALLLMSCGSSEEAAKKQDFPPPTTTAQQQQEPVRKTDTVNVNVQTTPKPEYDAKSSTPTTQSVSPAGNFSIQVGAYKMQENADRVAALAKERFGKTVYTIPDRVNNLFKVMVGDFSVKDEARRFRDDMAQKYPGDYKDAWVADNSQK